mgnify:FL=1
MTYDETLKIMAVLKAAYPGYYKDMKRSEAEGVVALWQEMFAPDSYRDVALAVKGYIATDSSGFPPNIGQVRTALARLFRPPEMSEMEAWGLLRRAIRGASTENWSRRMLPDGSLGKTSAEENFSRLPPPPRARIGSPRQLAEWEMLGDGEINTVIQSNFMRSWRAFCAREQNMASLPETLKRAALPAPEEGGTA